MRNRRRATSADVAREAGVSRATVSYVLNDTPNQKIPEQTRERVLEAARRLAYSPSSAARALRRGRSDVVLGVMTTAPIGVVLGHILNGLTEHLSAEGLTFVFHLHGNGGQTIAEVRQALTPAGVIVVGELEPADEDDLEAATTTGLVRLKATATGLSESATGALPIRSAIDIAGRTAAQLQAEHLTDAGHTKLAFAYYDDPAVQLTYLAELRFAGVRDVCERLGLPAPLEGVVGSDLEGSTRLVHGWAEAGITAVCAYNDETALAVMSAAEDAGLKVPDDLAVIGMDDIPSARSARPPLTTVALDADALAAHVTGLLMAGTGVGTAPELGSQTFTKVIVRASA